MSLLKRLIVRMLPGSTTVSATTLKRNQCLDRSVRALSTIFPHIYSPDKSKVLIYTNKAIPVIARNVQSSTTFFNSGGDESFDTRKDKSFYIKLRGHPFSATEQHIIDFLKGADVKVKNGAASVFFQMKYSGIRFIDCFVEVETSSDIEKALSLDRKNITADRYVEVHRISGIKGLMKAVPPVQSTTGHSVHMISVSSAFTEEDVSDFFSPLKPSHIELRTFKTKTREVHRAFVDFDSHETACKAMECDGNSIKDAPIPLKLLSYDGICDSY